MQGGKLLGELVSCLPDVRPHGKELIVVLRFMTPHTGHIHIAFGTGHLLSRLPERSTAITSGPLFTASDDIRIIRPLRWVCQKY